MEALSNPNPLFPLRSTIHKKREGDSGGDAFDRRTPAKLREPLFMCDGISVVAAI